MYEISNSECIANMTPYLAECRREIVKGHYDLCKRALRGARVYLKRMSRSPEKKTQNKVINDLRDEVKELETEYKRERIEYLEAYYGRSVGGSVLADYESGNVVNVNLEIKFLYS